MTDELDKSFLNQLRGEYSHSRSDFIAGLVVNCFFTFGLTAFWLFLYFTEVPTSWIFLIFAAGTAGLGATLIMSFDTRYEFNGTEVIYRLWGKEKKRMNISSVTSISIERARSWKILILHNINGNLRIPLYSELKEQINNANSENVKIV